MIHIRHTGVLGAAAVALMVWAITGCGGDDGADSSARPVTPTGQPATIGIAEVGELGDVLVDAQGRTLYLFDKDVGTTSACTGDCVAAWPPSRAAGRPVVGDGLTAARVGTTARGDGEPEVTYNRHPLYRFAGDTRPGEANGQGLNDFGGAWYAVSPAGDRVVGQASRPGGGYGY